MRERLSLATFGSTARWLVLGATIAVAALLAGCGGGEEGAATGSGTPQTATVPSPTQSETSAPPATETTAPPEEGTSITDYLAYTGGTAGAADPELPPVVIGWVNQQGGPVEIGKTTTDGARLAVQYVNEKLGGADGHPVELKECFIAQAEEEGQQCAQELANDDAVAVIVFGAVGMGNESFFSTLAGEKPVVIGVSVSPVDSVQENAGILFGDVTYILGPFGTYARDVLQAETAAVVYPDTAGTTYQADVTSAALETAGIDVKTVAYNPQAVDLTAPLTAAGAQTADVVVPLVNPQDCVNMAKALDQVGHEGPILVTPVCLTPTTIEGLGDFPTWTYAVAASLTLDVNDPAVPPYQQVLTDYGYEASIGDPWFEAAFSEILTTVKFLNAVGYDNISPESVLEELRAFDGPLALGAPEIECGKYPEAPAACNDQTQFYSYEGQGTFSQASSWLRPPTSN